MSTEDDDDDGAITSNDIESSAPRREANLASDIDTEEVNINLKAIEEKKKIWIDDGNLDFLMTFYYFV